MTKTFKELLDEALEKSGKTKSDLGRVVLGRKSNPFQGYYDLTTEKSKRALKLSPERMEKLCVFLGVPLTHFSDPDMTARRESYIRAEFAKFMQSEVAQETDPEILAIIEQIPFNGPKLPTKALYQAIAIAMRGGKYSSAQLLEAAQENEALAQVDRQQAKPKKVGRRAPDNDAKPRH